MKITRQWLDSEANERLEREKAFQRGYLAGRQKQSEMDVEAVKSVYLSAFMKQEIVAVLKAVRAK